MERTWQTNRIEINLQNKRFFFLPCRLLYPGLDYIFPNERHRTPFPAPKRLPQLATECVTALTILICVIYLQFQSRGVKNNCMI